MAKALSLSLPVFKKKPQQSAAKKIKTALSIDIGNKMTKIVIGRQKGNTIGVEKAFAIRTPENACYDGLITNTEELGRVLKDFISKSNIRLKDVIFTIESTKIIKRELIIPEVSDDDMLGVVTYEMGQYLPIDTNSYIIQCKKLEKITSEDGSSKMKVSVGALPKNIIEDYMKMLSSVGLQPHAMDIHSNALEKLVQMDIANNKSREVADKNVVFVDMGHTFFNIAVFENGKCTLNRVMEIGGQMIDKLISDRLQIDSFKAESVKWDLCSKINVLDIARKYGDLSKIDMNGRTDNEKILIEMISIINYWMNQIEKVFKYYTTRDRNNSIDQIYIYGGCSLINGIDDYFEKRFSVRSGRITSLGQYDYLQSGMAKEMPLYTNAIGALIRS